MFPTFIAFTCSPVGSNVTEPSSFGLENVISAGIVESMRLHSVARRETTRRRKLVTFAQTLPPKMFSTDAILNGKILVNFQNSID